MCIRDRLLINPWARSSGWAGANVAGVRGLEGIYSNVAGLAFVEKTELIFSQTLSLIHISEPTRQAENSYAVFCLKKKKQKKKKKKKIKKKKKKNNTHAK